MPALDLQNELKEHCHGTWEMLEIVVHMVPSHSYSDLAGGRLFHLRLTGGETKVWRSQVAYCRSHNLFA